MAVLHDEVLPEEAKGLLRRGGGEADQRGVEVLQDLPPEVVDGAVAFVGHDDVEGLDGYGGVVLYWLYFLVNRIQSFYGFLIDFFRQIHAFEHGVKSLNSTNVDTRYHVDVVGC